MVDCWRTDYSWFGLNRLGVVLVQTLEGAVSHLAQIRLSVVIWVGHIEHRTARSDTPCREKTTEWFTCMGGAARC